MGALCRNLRKAVAPIERFARVQHRAPSLDAKLHAIAVEFDFMRPDGADRRFVHQPRELGRHEIRHLYARYFGRGFLPAVAARRDGFFFFTAGAPTSAGSSAAALARLAREDCHTRGFLLAAISSSVRPDVTEVSAARRASGSPGWAASSFSLISSQLWRGLRPGLTASSRSRISAHPPCILSPCISNFR